MALNVSHRNCVDVKDTRPDQRVAAHVAEGLLREGMRIEEVLGGLLVARQHRVDESLTRPAGRSISMRALCCTCSSISVRVTVLKPDFSARTV